MHSIRKSVRSKHSEPTQSDPILKPEPEELEPEPSQVEPMNLKKAEPIKVEQIQVEPILVEPSQVEPILVEPSQVEPILVEPSQVEPMQMRASNPLTLADRVFKYETCDADALKKCKCVDICQLIAMIRQLYFFSECNKRCVRTYTLHKEDIPKLILKLRKRTHLKIDTYDINLYDHASLYHMFCRLKAMIGMFHINDFMVRVEHAFDNAQIRAEHSIVTHLIKHANYDGINGIDSEHHIVVPVCVQLNNIGKIPESVRTMFHHISYSIQPFVWNSQTLDAWFHINNPSNEMLAKMCGQMAKALDYLHTHDIVHGDIKPANTLVCISSVVSMEPVLYVIDYGMSGLHNESEGTGGTKPFCAPETGNGCAKTMNLDAYKWTKNKKENDMWSFGLMFFTMMTLRKCMFYMKDYPPDFFDDQNSGHITPSYFNQINDEPMRNLFRRTLCPVEERLTAVDFLHEINKINP
jgi:hypothetical protein